VVALGRPHTADREKARPTGYRSLSIIFNPWNSGHTTVSVVTLDFRGDRRIVHRIGAIDLPVGRLALSGLAPVEVTGLLVNELQEWLSDHRPTLPSPKGSGAPLGATGGTVTQCPGQQTLDLDLTV